MKKQSLSWSSLPCWQKANVRTLILALGCILCSVFWNNASAVEPENGWWYSPDKLYMGLQLELQDSMLLVGYFAEKNGGRITYNGGCDFDGKNCHGELLQGIEPTGIQFTMSFPDDGLSGTALIDGEVLEIKRFKWAWQPPPVDMRGIWIMNIRAGTIYTGEGLVLGEVENNNGDTILSGVRDRTDRRAVVLYDKAEDSYVVAVDDGPNSINLYTLQQSLGVNTMTGTVVITDKSGKPQTETFSATAMRIAQQVPANDDRDKSIPGKESMPDPDDAISEVLFSAPVSAVDRQTGSLMPLSNDEFLWRVLAALNR